MTKGITKELIRVRLSLPLLTRHYLSTLPVPIRATLTLMGSLRVYVLAEVVIGFLIGASKWASYSDNSVLSILLGHGLEQQEIALLSALE
jgi:hypothetical protein